MVSAKTESFGSYAIERRIAVGGMAEVFAASAQAVVSATLGRHVSSSGRAAAVFA